MFLNDVVGTYVSRNSFSGQCHLMKITRGIFSGGFEDMLKSCLLVIKVVVICTNDKIFLYLKSYYPASHYSRWGDYHGQKKLYVLGTMIEN